MRRTDRSVSHEESLMFREAVRGTRPLKTPVRITGEHREPPPVPVQSLLDAHSTLAESARGPLPWEQSMETGEELLFFRPGIPREVVKRLRRGHWVVQDTFDLHGMTREQARHQLAQFLVACVKRRMRCVRIIHGKGLRSPNREPVLRGKVRHWLSQRDDVLCFCQAPANQGGAGAVLVLLKG